MRPAGACCLGAVAIVVAVAAGALDAQGVQTQSQLFFRTKLLSDTKTSQDIQDLLRTGGGFVDRSIGFRDLTGDKRTDAIVRVHTGGAAGVVALYVLSTDTAHGGDQLEVVYRHQRLLRASTRLRKDVLSFRSAAYADGDELCCPSKLVETTLRWDAKAKRFGVAERKDVPGPGATPTPTAAPTETPTPAATETPTPAASTTGT